MDKELLLRLRYIEWERDRAADYLQALGDIHLMVMGCETPNERAIAELLEDKFKFTRPRKEDNNG